MLRDNSIIIRISQFLKSIPPFEYFDSEDLKLLASNAQIGVYKNTKFIFKQGHKPKETFFVVKKGAIEIQEERHGVSILIDKCGEGDIFGIRPLIAESTYLYSAIAIEDSIIYEINNAIFKEQLLRNKQSADYMMQRFAAGYYIRNQEGINTTLPSLRNTFSTSIRFLSSPDKFLISTFRETSFKDAIITMDKYGVSSIIISDKKGLPIGIITDRDIRRHIAKGFDFEVPVENVMNAPVACIPPNLSIQEVQLTMIEKSYHHLCITEDGTDESKGIGMVTEHDLLYAAANDPIVIIKKIKNSTKINSLKETRKKIDQLATLFLDDNLNAITTLSMIDKLNRAIISKTVDLALQEYNTKHSPIMHTEFAFFTMGSAARGEQLLMTDQDHGIVINNKCRERQNNFLRLGEIISDNLNEIGYEYCPAKMMSSRSDWCKSLDDYKSMINDCIDNPGGEEVLLSSIFFDFQYEYGDSMLIQNLKSHLSKVLKNNDFYFRFIAKQATSNPPPLSFFRKFIVEKNGEHKDLLDIKLRGIATFTDSARVLALHHDYIEFTNTIERFEYMKTVDNNNVVLFDDCIEAFTELLKIKLRFAISKGDSGRYIDPSELNKLDRIKLRRAFEINRKLSNFLENNYKLNYL